MATPSRNIHSTSPFPNISPTPTNPSPPTAEPRALHPTPTPPPAVASPQGVRRRFQFQPPPLGVGIGVVADVVRARALAQGNFELGSRDQQQEREKSDNDEWNRNERLSQLDPEDEVVPRRPERGSDSTKVSPSLTEPNRRKRSTGSTEANLDLWKRLPYAEGYPDCNYVDNSILTCYPESNTTLVQSVWSKVIFNAQYPLFIGSGAIDAYLYRADSETLATSYLGIETARGMFAIRPDDDWWPVNQTSWVEGTNQTWRYYFVVVSNGTKLNRGETHQQTFAAVQTAAPSTLISSLSSLSASASASAFAVSAARASPNPTSLSSHPNFTSPTATSNNLLQPYPGPSLALPSWAIALIVSLGVLIVLLLAILGLVRKRRRRGTREGFSRSGTEDKDEEGKEYSGERTPSLLNESEGGQRVEGNRSGGTSSLTPITTSIATKAPRRSLSSRTRSFNFNQDYQAVRGGSGNRKMQDPTVVGLLSPVDAEIITRAFKDELRRPEIGEEDDSERYAGRE
ncbi:hypothetical protein MVLG_01301 [Microbotryum lychnidis-dioicae p1A1 Lamole]|uniref:Uncharacterized protein n=1 Tax=Microbotryum lychnidis-dioicae (strain p1A1 Lamole / MvSl-1064) TaxID=683840 RepID=U5H1P8_USTV1|nr:hypothetical protein MVLG_01301 [Microbotryum lychnidis-dioicae p1A1 Lamole]|eukprot:KDE08522.1 hypothetical protein MVLG_01301 [Microbotryum lychnidis-dioicae p1A1 Lamole]